MAYVYSVLIADVVRYIGKGVGRRSVSHEKLAAKINARRAAGEKIRTTRFYNELAKAMRDGQSVRVEIIADGLTDAEAIDLEKKTIAESKPGLVSLLDWPLFGLTQSLGAGSLCSRRLIWLRYGPAPRTAICGVM